MSWIEKLPLVLEEWSTSVHGVIHVGAHLGEEVEFYQAWDLQPIVLVEPLPYCAAKLREMHGVTVVERAIASEIGFCSLFVTKNPKRSSILRPIEDVKGQQVEETLMTNTIPLSDLESDKIDLLVVDAQGCEYDVIRSGSLKNFRAIVIETREFRQYDGQGTHTQVDHYLTTHGFRFATCFNPRSKIRNYLYVSNANMTNVRKWRKPKPWKA